MNLVEQRTMGIEPGTFCCLLFCCSSGFSVCFMLVYVLFDCEKLKQTRRKHTTKQRKKQTNNKKQLKDKQQQTYIQNIQPSTRPPAHEPPRKINISKGLAGRCLFVLLVYVFLIVFYVCSVVMCFVRL